MAPNRERKDTFVQMQRRVSLPRVLHTHTYIHTPSSSLLQIYLQPKYQKVIVFNYCIIIVKNVIDLLIYFFYVKKLSELKQ